jgi:signal transduction histidine kinase
MLMRGISRFAGPRRSVLIWVVVLFVIAGLLATTAVLQYRWIKQISSSLEIQVRSNLQSQMTQWSLDFYGELSAICVALQVGPDSGARDDWTDYLQRYSEWSRKHLAQGSLENIRSNPALISRIYIWETSERAKPRLLFLDPSSNQIEQIAIPPQLEPLLVRLKESSQNLPMALRAWELPDPQNPAPDVPGQPQSSRKHDDPITGWQFDENIPAIVHPLVHHVEPLVHAKTQIPRANEPVDWIVIVLDLATIQKTVLPQLANRYFGNDQELDYKLAVVVTGKPPHVIYSSDVNFPDTNSGAFDSTMNVFGPPPESTEGHLWESLKNVESLRRQDWRTFSGPGWFPVIQYQTGTDPWMLVVKRRAGPLSAVVNRVWRTNLFTGLAVLFLLTASVGLAILATQRVQRLASLQMNFVANVSHELRTPLTVILSAAENIADGVVEEQSAVKEHGGIITSQGRLLLDLVDRILLFAASTAGKKLQFLRPVQVSAILERALQNVAGIAQLAGIEIEKSIQPDLPNILADPVALCQCVQNLIVNAIKYRGRSNWISISAELQQSKDSARQICIRVQDRGIGIRDSELQRIFEPFYRSPETFATNVQGTGLGLTVTQRSVSDMGGKLMVSSTIGVGSTFTIQLPVAESFAVAPLMPHSDGTLGHSR